MASFHIEQRATAAVSDPVESVPDKRVVVCGVGASANAPSVASFAGHVASELDAGLLLMHVTDTAAGGVKAAFLLDRLNHTALVDAMGLLETVRKESGTTFAVARAELGSPARRLVEAAERRGADLIVIGSGRPRAGILRLIEGVRERVISDAPCPVIVVPRTSDRGLDASAESEAVWPATGLERASL
jgi:nucleotide-binding universal stress UspA family protein